MCRRLQINYIEQKCQVQYRLKRYTGFQVSRSFFIQLLHQRNGMGVLIRLLKKLLLVRLCYNPFVVGLYTVISYLYNHWLQQIH